MKNQTLTLLTIVAASLLILLGCSPDDNSDSKKAEKNLFSLWTPQDQTDPTLSLENLDFNQQTGYAFTFSTGDQCNCLIRFIGTQSSGQYTLNSCTYVVGSGNGLYSNCSALNHSGTYSKSSDTLTICNNTGVCSVYE
jgi:hypothetical protein